MRVAIVINTEQAQTGLLGQALDEAGAITEHFHPLAGESLPDDPASHDALVVLGGDPSALDDARYPYLGDLARIMQRWAMADKAVLGICLGAQLLARGFGADNQIGTVREFGWCPIRPTEQGRKDPVIGVIAPQSLIFEWHRDTFTLPQGAEHLAENSDVTQQAFRIGRAAYGMQFHFEAGRDEVSSWTARFPEATEAMQPGWAADHQALSARHGPAADAMGLTLARAWIAMI